MEIIRKERVVRAQRIIEKRDIDAILLFNPLSDNGSSISFNYFVNIRDYEPLAMLIKRDYVVLYDSQKREAIYNDGKREVKGLYDLLTKEEVKTVGVEDIRFSLAVWLNKKGIVLQDLRKDLLELRMIKSRDEIDAIKRAGKETRRIFYDILPHIWNNEEEKVARRIKCNCLESGECAFEPIVAAEENSSKVHHLPTKRIIDKHVLLDFGFKNQYCSDFSITLTKVNKRKKEWEILRNIFLNVTDKINEGMSLEDVDKCMYAEMKKVFKENEIYKAHHLLGHGVGMEVHEYPSFSSSIFLRKNMVIAIEPAVYKRGWGMRIEDTFIVGRRGVEAITKIHNNEF